MSAVVNSSWGACKASTLGQISMVEAWNSLCLVNGKGEAVPNDSSSSFLRRFGRAIWLGSRSSWADVGRMDIIEQLSRDFGGGFGTLDSWSEGREELSSTT